MSTNTQSEGITISRVIDLGIVATIVVVFVLKFAGLETPGLALSILLPGLGVAVVVIAVVDSVIRRGVQIADILLVLSIAIVGGLYLAGKEKYAIAFGTLVPPAVGLLVIGFGLIEALIKRGHTTGHDFSSLSKEEERAFIPHEEWMRNNAKRAVIIGFGSAGVLFVVAIIIVQTLFSPCSEYCKRAPVGCKTDTQIADFKRTCESSCGAMERSKGPDYIETLKGCAFAGATNGGCEPVTKAAQEAGIWCEIKN